MSQLLTSPSNIWLTGAHPVLAKRWFTNSPVPVTN